MKNKLVEPWELKTGVVSIIILILTISMEITCRCITERFPVIFSIVTGLFGGFIATFFVFFIQRKYRSRDLRETYSQIAGNYIRFDIGQDNTPKLTIENLDTIPHPSEIIGKKNIQEDNRKLPIKIIYEGENTFKINADYWYSKNCKVEATIEFGESNKSVAHGRYLYTQGELIGHFGTYTIYKFNETEKKLLVLFQHIYPREKKNNPDANRGWEIWIKT